MRRTYIAIVSGQFTKCEANNDTPDRCHQNVTNLFQQLDREHRGWTDWQESATNPCDWVDSGDPPQQPGHPLALFTGGPVKPASTRLAMTTTAWRVRWRTRSGSGTSRTRAGPMPSPGFGASSPYGEVNG